MSKSKVKNRLINLAVFVTTLLILLAIYLGIFFSYKKKLDTYEKIQAYKFEDHDYGPLTQADLVQLGHAQDRATCPKSSYLHYPFEKDSGKYRIGVFGCSFVFGDESAYGYDLPSWLQKNYDKAGKEVEVLNFGKGAYGMHQSYYVWSKIAHLYDLDLVIFNLLGFHSQRDETFIYRWKAFGPMHGRYVWENAQLKYIPVSGNSTTEASESYFRPFPPLKYIKYDRKPPVPIRAVMPKGRRLSSNPFYYHPNPKTEWEDIYTAIFDTVAHHSKQVVLIFPSKQLGKFTENLSAQNVSSLYLKSHALRRTPPSFYSAPMGHPSGLGYQLMADELFAFLNDSSHFSFTKVFFTSLPDDGSFGENREVHLDKVHKLSVSIEGKELGVLVEPRPGLKNKWMPFNVKKHQSQAMLSWPGKSHLRFVPLKKPLTGKGKLEIQFLVKGEKQSANLGTVGSLSRMLGQVQWKDSSLTVQNVKISFSFGKVASIMLVAEEKISGVKILLDKSEILQGVETQSKETGLQAFRLVPTMGPWVNVQASTQQQLDIHTMNSTGIIDLKIHLTKKDSFEMPFTSYQLIKVTEQSIK